jgi:isopenicillin N synthase-like dioxygenase
MSFKRIQIQHQEMATFKTIDYKKLLCNDHNELVSLLSACTEDGFFWLDLSATETKDQWSSAEEIFTVMTEIFEQPLDTKLDFDSVKFGLDGLNG